MQDILSFLDISLDDLTNLSKENVNIFSMLYGYSAEVHIRNYFDSDARITDLKKYDDHDKLNRHDLAVMYKGREYTIEVKCIQNSSLKINDDTWAGQVQVQNSSGHFQTLPNGEEFYSKLREFGQFDILAIATNALGNGWEFRFMLNRDLPITRAKKVPDEYKHIFINTTIPVSPDTENLSSDPFVLLERLHTERENTTNLMK